MTTPVTISKNYDATSTSGTRWMRWVRLASLLCVVVSLVMLVRILPVDKLVALLSSKVEGLGVWGPVVFGVVYVVGAVLFVPGSAMTLAAGAVFGLVTGTIVVSLAATSAAAVSFLIGRYLARDAVRSWAGKSPSFGAIDRAIGERGWKIIALLRLSPAMPFSLGNYLFGITSIPFVPYILTSWIAMLPGTFMYVYLGYAGRAGLGAATGAGEGRSPAQWALLVVGLLATIVVTVYVTRVARKAVKENTVATDNSSEASSDTQHAARSTGVWGTVLTAALALGMAGCTVLAYANRTKIAGLFGPPVVSLGESYAEKPDGPRVDHTAFDNVLKRHVDSAGLVDYVALKTDPAELDAYIASLATVPLDELGRNERLTLLINAYNALTLRLILDHFPVKSIKDIPSDQRWDAKRWNVGGNVWSLNQIEHEQVRPHFREPRIHFALVCAAIGCPPLRAEAYARDRLEEQLAAQTKYVHTHDRWFVFDPGANVVKLTSLYDWFAGDFKQVGDSVLKYAAGYSEPLKQALDRGDAPRVEFLNYDWSLNTQEIVK